MSPDLVAQWLEYQPVHQKVECLIPCQEHVPGLQVQSPVPVTCRMQPIHVCVSHFPFLRPSLPLLKKDKWKKDV